MWNIYILILAVIYLDFPSFVRLSFSALKWIINVTMEVLMHSLNFALTVRGILGFNHCVLHAPFIGGGNKFVFVGQKVLNVWLKTFAPCSGRYENERQGNRLRRSLLWSKTRFPMMHRSSSVKQKTRKQTKQLSKQTLANRSVGPDCCQSNYIAPSAIFHMALKRIEKVNTFLLVYVLRWCVQVSTQRRTALMRRC